MSEPNGENSPTEARRKKPWTRWIGRSVWTLVGIGAAFHAYALTLAIVPAPTTANMTLTALSGTGVTHRPVSLSQISPNLVLAVIAAEDSRFCQHGGIDTEAVQKAIDEANRGRRQRGASTISQQTAKNVFLWNGGGMPRKAAEAWMTLFIETVWGKRRIMEHYLNVAEWGDGLYGAEAAAQARFGKSAAQLTRREAALLAAVLPSPNKWRVDPPGPYVSERAGTIQSRMNVVEGEGLAACVLGK